MEKLDIQPLDIQPLSENKLDIQPLDIQPLEGEAKKSFLDDAVEGVKGAFGQIGNTADIGLTLAGSNLARLFQGADEQEAIFKAMDKRIAQRNKRFAPGADQSFLSKAVGMVGTLPAQMALMPLSPIETGKTFIDNNESSGKTAAAMGIDAALTAAGMVLPGAAGASRLTRAISGAGINAGQETANRAILSTMADKEETKKAFEPSWEAAALAAIPGAGFGVMSKGKKAIDTTPEARMKAAAEARKLAEKAASVEASPEAVKKLPDVFEVDKEGNTYPQGENVEFWKKQAENKVAEERAAQQLQNLQDPERQMGLPFDTSMEEVAARKAQREGQMDWIAELDKTPDGFNEQLRKAAIDEPQLDMQRRAEQDVQRQQQEDMFRSREEELAQQKADEAQAIIDEDLFKQQDALSQERVSKGQQRKMNRGMGRGQRGGMLFGDGSDRVKAVEDILNTKFTTEAPKGEDVVSAALQEDSDGRGINMTESGGTLTALKRRSAAVLGASRILQRAQNDADLAVRQNVMPVEKSLRRLDKAQMSQLMSLFKEETSMKQKFSAEDLVSFGYDAKMLAAYNDMRAMFTKTLEAQNEARAARGEKPITELEYYTSHRWNGDFRQDFLDTQGNHVWSLAGKTKKDLTRQREALLRKFPELKASKERVVKQGKDVASPAELYKHMLDILGEDDPAVQRVKQWYEQNGVMDPAADMLAQEKHFKHRGDVRGYIGDRPSNTRKGTFDAATEALDFFQEQITYAKNGLKWAEMQKAGNEIKKIVSDPALQEQQPNNVRYIKDYWKQNLGVSEAKWVGALEDNLHDIGISPREVRNVVGDVKSAWIGQKLLGSAGFVLSNVVQAAAVLPHMADIAAQTGGNPLRGLVGGMIGLMHIGLPHLVNTFRPSKEVSAVRKASMMVMPDFYNKAMKYAEDNGVTSRSTYDESPISASFSKPRQAAELAGKISMVVPETALRSFAFTAFAEQLKSSGKYADDMEIFRLAEERTNAALVDYRSGERPMLFSKGGMLGDIAGTLQTFPINFYNQWNWAAREAAKGNYSPALTMFATQATIAGAMGLPGFQDMDKAFEQIKDWAAKHDPKLWNKIKDWNPKRVVMDHLGEAALYGKLSTATNTAMTSRVSAPSVTEMVTSGGNMIGDIGKQIGDVAKLAYSPSKEQMAKTILDIAPVGTQGALETGPLRDITSTETDNGQLYFKRGTHQGDFVRSPDDEAKRALGMRSQHEALVKDETYQAEKRGREARQVSQDLVGHVYSAMRKGSKEDAASYARLYTELTGKAITDKQIENHILKEFTSRSQRALTGAKQLEAIRAMKRMQEIVNNAELSQ